MQQVSLYCLLLMTPPPPQGHLCSVYIYLLEVSNAINNVDCYATQTTSKIQNSDSKQNSSKKGAHALCAVYLVALFVHFVICHCHPDFCELVYSLYSYVYTLVK